MTQPNITCFSALKQENNCSFSFQNHWEYIKQKGISWREVYAYKIFRRTKGMDVHGLLLNFQFSGHTTIHKTQMTQKSYCHSCHCSHHSLLASVALMTMSCWSLTTVKCTCQPLHLQENGPCLTLASESHSSESKWQNLAAKESRKYTF